MELPILRTTENAFALLALSASLSQSLGYGVYTGIGNMDKPAPAIICYAENGTEDFPFSGIYHVRTHVMVKEMAFDTDPLTGSFADNIFAALCNNNTKNNLNTYPNYYVYEYFIQGTNDGFDEDTQIQEMTFDVVSAIG
jgi:hypothetical protein